MRKKLGMTGHDAQFPYEIELGQIEVIPVVGDLINITLDGHIITLEVKSRRFIINSTLHMSDVFISASVVWTINQIDYLFPVL